MRFEVSQIESIIIKNEKLLDHKLGWRFINSSKETIQKNSGIGIITLNPGGKIFEKPVFSLNKGKNAYLDENWGDFNIGEDPLQIQIKALFEEINKRILYSSDFKDLMRASFMAHFIPYRSHSYDDLKNKRETLILSKNIWVSFIGSKLFNFKILICIGKKQFEILEEILMGNSNFMKIKSNFILTGWGNYQSEISTFSDNKNTFKLVYLQHLSRFKIFNRREGQENINELINYIVE
jgi:hypothetical protein